MILGWTIDRIIAFVVQHTLSEVIRQRHHTFHESLATAISKMSIFCDRLW